MRALLLGCAVACVGCVHRMPERPTTVVFAARLVRTQDAARPTAQAVVVRDGKVAFIGTREAAVAFAGPGAALEVFEGATLVPGLADAHAHLESLGRALSVVSLEPARSEADAVALAKQAGKGAFQGEWLTGRGWDQNDWAVKDFPTRASLDAAFPAIPVFLTRVDGHAAWVNSVALARAGLTRDSKDPQGGRFLRDAKGELTGVLIDNAIDVVSARLPPLSDEVRRHHLKVALETCARLGLTQVHDAGMELKTFRQLQQWDMEGALPLRIYAMADGQGPDAQEYLGLGPFKGQNLEMRAVKFLADGALGSRGAALHQPYADEPKQSGLLLLEPAFLAARAKEFAERGFQVAVHAIGDKANSTVIDTLGALEKAKPGSRHRVEHAQVLTQADVGRFATLGLVASYQPTHATSDMPWAEARLGKERTRYAYAWRSVLDSGAHVAFGSDFPVEDPNPLWGLYAARTRQDRQGQPPGGWMPEQRVSGEEALAGFTTGAAWASFSEGSRGVLKEGMDADFVVLPVDPVADDARALLDAKVLLTVVGGVDVYRAP